MTVRIHRNTQHLENYGNMTIRTDRELKHGLEILRSVLWIIFGI